MSKFTVVLLAGALALGACGASEPATDDVATLRSATPAATTSTASAAATPAADDERPQLRLDTSDQERDRLQTIYDDCLVAHGVKAVTVSPPGEKPARRLLREEGPKSAFVACGSKLPRQPPELDPDRNPRYATQWNDWVRCMRGHGVLLHATGPGDATWDSDDTPIPDNYDELEKSCNLEVFGGKK